MVKKALVFVSDRKKVDPYWEDYEYEKANTFMEALMNWGWLNDNIFTVGDRTKFFHGNPIKYYLSETRDPAIAGNPPNQIRDYNKGLDKAFGYLDNLVQGGNSPPDVMLNDPPVLDYVIWISDYCPVGPPNQTFEIRQHGSPNDKFNPTIEVFDHLEAMLARHDSLNSITLIFSGKGSGYLALNLIDPRWRVIASHDGTLNLDNQTRDEFNIGIVMPQIPVDDWDQAFWAEIARLNGQQTPLKWP